MDGRIKVYVPKEQLNEVISGNKPVNFWLSKPDSWSMDNIVEVQIPLDIYTEWTRGRTDGKRLLKG
tara:strand:+ start:1683 stop:1880 length:198 start_codon:yes stop_codon:yes gene_type:complete